MQSPNITQDQIRLMNRTKILRLLRERGVLTKHELGTALALSHTTINTCVQLLLEEGLVAQVGVGKSVGGRKPAMIALKADSRHFFGVYFAPDRVIILVVNLRGEELARETLIQAGVDFEETLGRVRETIWKMIEACGLDTKEIVGVGMSFPGVVDAGRNFVEYAPNLGIRGYCFNSFEQKLGFKLYLENESIAATYAELFIGKAKDKKSIVYVSIAEGIGTGIIIDNRILRDINKKAGDFGHIRIENNGRPCNCGRADCWEVYASKTALFRYYREYLEERESIKAETLEALEAAFDAGEPAAAQAVDTYTRQLFHGIEIILLALSPDEVIVGGDLGAFTQKIIRLGTETLALNQKFYGYEDVPIVASGFKENGAIIGSALLPLEAIYDLQPASRQPAREMETQTE